MECINWVVPHSQDQDYEIDNDYFLVEAVVIVCFIG
jgi:hypothetical protein